MLSKYTEPLAHPAATYLSFYRAPAQLFYMTNIYKDIFDIKTDSCSNHMFFGRIEKNANDKV